MKEEAQIETAKVIDSKVLSRCDTSQPKPGTVKPYIVYLNEDEVKNAERQNRRRIIMRMLLFLIGILLLFMCFCTFQLYRRVNRVAPSE